MLNLQPNGKGARRPWRLGLASGWTSEAPHGTSLTGPRRDAVLWGAAQDRDV